MKLSLALALGAFSQTIASHPTYGPSQHEKKGLRVENFISTGPALDMVSSLIIGSQGAVIIDISMTIPQAEELAEWVTNTTDKPLVAAFSTHSHPDHYLGGTAFLAKFPGAKLYASTEVAALIKNEAVEKAAYWDQALGPGFIVQNITYPTPYDFTFFTLPGDEHSPIHLVSPLVGDTIDETMFWIPSISTLIAGDTVYSHTVHVWLSDLLTTSLTEAWLSTLDFVASLKPKKIIPGHSLSTKGFGPSVDLEHTRDYVTYFQKMIEAKGADYYTPKQIYNKFDAKFPGLLSGTSGSSALILNITSEEFGRGGTRFVHYVDLDAFNNATALEGWKVGH